MFNAGRISASLGLNTQQFRNSLRAAQLQARKIGRQFSNAFGNSTQSNINNTNRALKNTQNELKEINRIVGGILISQAFYGATQHIQQASSAMTEFMNNMEKAHIAMEYFLGSAKESKAFIMNMKDFAAVTAFSTEQALVLSRRLMGAQFNPTQLRHVMTILNDANAATGATAEQMDRIVLAMTQMKTNGKIMATELRQFAEAGIPIYQILREELQLTGEEVLNIGNMKISGDLGVAAVLSGLEKRYKGAAHRIAQTVPGMWETIQDDAKFVGEKLFEGPYQSLKNFLTRWRDAMEEARFISVEKGIGGVFEHFVSPKLHESIRNIVGSMRSLRQSVSILLEALRPAAEVVGGVLVKALGEVLPIIASVARAVANLGYAAMNIIPGIKYLAAAIGTLFIATAAGKALYFLWSVARIGVICAAVAKAVNTLTRAIAALWAVTMRNPIVAMIALLAAGIMYLALSSKTAQRWISGFTNSLAKLAGYDVNSILQPEDGKSLGEWTEKYNQQLEDMKSNMQKVGDESKKTGKKLKDTFISSFDEVYQVPEKLDDAAGGMEALAPDMTVPNMTMPELPVVDTSLPTVGLPALDVTSFKDTLVSTFKDLPRIIGDFFMDTLPKAFTAAVEWIKANGPGMLEGAKETLADFGGWLMQFDIVKSAYNNLKEFWSEWGGDVTGFFSNTWELLKTAWSIGAEGVKALAESMFDNILKFWEEWGDDVLGFFGGLWELLKLVFDERLEELKKLWEDWGPGITVIVENIWETIKIVFDEALEAILLVVGTTFSFLNDSVQIALALLKGDWEDAWNIMRDRLDTTLTSIGELLGIAIEAIKKVVGVWAEDFKISMEDLWTTITTKTEESWNSLTTWLSETLSSIWQNFSDFGDDTLTSLKETWDSATSYADEVWNTFYTWMDTKLGNIWQSFSDFGDDTLGTVKDTWDDATAYGEEKWDKFKEYIGTLTEGIEDTFEGMKEAVLVVFEGLWTGIKSTLNTIISGVNSMITKLNGVKIDVPKISIPGTDVSLGGGSISLPKIPNIPGLQTGGIINKRALIEAGEYNRPEAVVPLTDPHMAPFADAVAERIAGISGGNGGQDNRTPVYVHTLVADKRGLKELERQLNIIRINEGMRGAQS